MCLSLPLTSFVGLSVHYNTHTHTRLFFYEGPRGCGQTETHIALASKHFNPNHHSGSGLRFFQFSTLLLRLLLFKNLIPLSRCSVNCVERLPLKYSVVCMSADCGYKTFFELTQVSSVWTVHHPNISSWILMSKSRNTQDF